MKKETSIKLFNESKVRVHWVDKNEKWYFSIVDVIRILTESPNPRKVLECFKNKA